MATVRLTVTLDEKVAQLLRQRAVALRKPVSRHLADLIREDAQRHQDELATEGYQILARDTEEFATAAWSLAQETWPEYEVKLTPND